MKQIVAFFSMFYNFFMRYPTPPNLGTTWNFGVSALLFFAIQFVTGIFLSMSYVANADLAFLSVENIMRNVNHGWLIRYLHSNGASFFFLCVYLHTFRNIYYASFSKPRQNVWNIGVILLLLMILTAFTGYVSPWGQMSFWAATVITNLASAIPIFGDYIVVWLWGGFSVNTATLNRFFSFHFFLPFVMLFFICLHIIFLHERGSSNSMSVHFILDKMFFHPFFTSKDLYFLYIIVFIYLFFVGFYPNYFGHPDNYIPADPLLTPPHIVPEWYFLPFYAISRSIPSKLIGVLLLLFSIVALFVFPLLIDHEQRVKDEMAPFLNPHKFSKLSWIRAFFSVRRNRIAVKFWSFVGVCILLGIMGGKTIDSPYLEFTRLLVVFYFLYFITVAGIRFGPYGREAKLLFRSFIALSFYPYVIMGRFSWRILRKFLWWGRRHLYRFLRYFYKRIHPIYLKKVKKPLSDYLNNKLLPLIIFNLKKFKTFIENSIDYSRRYFYKYIHPIYLEKTKILLDYLNDKLVPSIVFNVKKFKAYIDIRVNYMESHLEIQLINLFNFIKKKYTNNIGLIDTIWNRILSIWNRISRRNQLEIILIYWYLKISHAYVEKWLYTRVFDVITVGDVLIFIAGFTLYINL